MTRRTEKDGEKGSPALIIGIIAGVACGARGMDWKETLAVVTVGFWGAKLLTKRED